MIEYDPDNKLIHIGCTVGWEFSVRPYYEMFVEDYRAEIEDGDIVVERLPLAADDLTDKQIDYIMEYVDDNLERQDNYESDLNIDESIHRAVEEWVEDYCQGHVE